MSVPARLVVQAGDAERQEHPGAAPVAAMSRRHAAGSSSARGLLFTVLGEYVLPAGGSAWTSALIETMSRLGVEEKATRQALMRTAADGWLTAERVGRRTRWQLTPSGDRLLTQGTERIYGFGAHRESWDGTWLLVLARTPEADRPARHVLRSRLTWSGFGSPAPGVWISTHPGRLAEVEAALAEAGLSGEAQIFRGTHADGQLLALVSQAWDLAGISQLYDDFVATFASASAADPLAATIGLVHAWRRFPWTDPDLPRELLPPHWRRPRAAALFRRRHAQWSPAAHTAWQHLAARDSPSEP
jgi:phenylacetic acid degradation operon negative regulatory protein